jgi:CubicO group peptidase (beta-lactamase class C family)
MEAECAIDQREIRSAGELGPVPWWSFTKTALAATALRLVETGVLRLDQRVAGERYTLRQLLRHEAGVTDYGGLADYQQAVSRGDPPWPVGELFERADADRLVFEPGEGWAYSNIGYLKLGQLIAVADGRSLEAAVRDLVFKPLGLEGARFATRREDLRGVCMGSASEYDPGWVYHGLIVGELADAARMLHALLSGLVLSPAMLIEMRRARRLPQFRTTLWAEPAYALGVMTPGLEDGRRLIGHTGEGPGSTIAVYGLDSPEGIRVSAAWSSTLLPSEVEARAVRLLGR